VKLNDSGGENLCVAILYSTCRCKKVDGLTSRIGDSGSRRVSYGSYVFRHSYDRYYLDISPDLRCCWGVSGVSLCVVSATNVHTYVEKCHHFSSEFRI
jgi:hypothetical protein